MSYRGEHVALDLPLLASGEHATFSAPPGEEAALVLLAGDVDWLSVRSTRADVFEAPASAVYIPPGGEVDVVANDDTELAFATTIGASLATNGATPEHIAPAGVVARTRGTPPWQREVHDLIADNINAHRLIVGETFNEPGQWSSFPPHKHDGADGEPALEEVYYFRFDNRDGFGFQGLYEHDGPERAVFLRHGTIVGIPRGYHPVCAAPGYRAYYLWVLVGSPRRLAMYEDPAHRWLRE